MSGSAWTKAEIATLRRIYPTQGNRAAMNALPGRSLEAVRTKAMKIGLVVDNPRSCHAGKPCNNKLPSAKGKTYAEYHWSTRELAILKRVYPMGGPKGASAALGGKRSPNACSAQAYKLGIRCHINGVGPMPAERHGMIVQALNRRRSVGGTVQAICETLGVHRSTVYKMAREHFGELWGKNT